MRVLVTGSRQLLNQGPVYEELDTIWRPWRARAVADLQDSEEFTVVHGGAPGADSFAGQWVHDRRGELLAPRQEVHPAEWGRHGKQAGPIRNHEMVVLGADVVLAFLVPGARNVGTRHCLEEARRWLGHKGTLIKEIWT